MTLDLSKPPYDLDTYSGRAMHFFRLTNPLNIFASDEELDEAKQAVETFKKNKYMPPGYNEEKLWNAKYLYDSAFHPDTGEKMMLIGRMSAQAPMNTLITGCMITFYKTNSATAFWQWFNQSFNAVVNYTNRSGSAPISKTRLMVSYFAACGGALTTALYLNSRARHMKPIYGRLVPFAAVGGTQFINVPLMRSNELANGTPVFTDKGMYIGESTRAALMGIGLVCISRVLMAVPGMTVTPMITNMLANRGFFDKHPGRVLPLQLFLVGICVTFATPLCCALFKQQAQLSLDYLEPHLEAKVKYNSPETKYVVFNKGL